MNKLLVGGALGALLIAGQAIAARLPDMVAARAAEPAVALAVAVTEDPATAPAARRAAPVAAGAELALSPVVDRLDPGMTPDPVAASGDVVMAGGLTDAETARLVVRRGEITCASLTWKCDTGEPEPLRTWDWWAPFFTFVAITTTAIVVATDDDSDS